MFTTSSGVASLILQEIPYRPEAYVRIRSCSDLGGLLDECVSFCKAVGAERIYATGHEGLLTMPKPLTVWITINCGKF